MDSYECDECEAKRDNETTEEIQRLAAFILQRFPDEPGRGHPNGIGSAPRRSESAVDVAVRLLGVFADGIDAIRKAYDEGDESEVAIAALEMIGEA